MQLTLVHDEQLITLSVDRTTTISTIKSLLQSEGVGDDVSANAIHFIYSGRTISSDNDTLEALRVEDNDVFTVQITRQQQRQQQQQLTPQQQQQNEQQRRQHLQAEEAHHMQLAILSQQLEDDPMNVELQMKLEKMIQDKNIHENMEAAYEHHPESFGRVVMLYVACEVNDKKLTAFVDSGAQSTIISAAMAKACNLMHLIDTRFEGVAVGVGSAKILGRIHSAQIRLGTSAVLVCSFTVLAQSSIDLLLGLDQLKRHQMTIDLKHNVLRVYEHEVPFLSEHEIQKSIEGEKHETEMMEIEANKDKAAAAAATATAAAKTMKGNTSTSSAPASAAVPLAARQGGNVLGSSSTSAVRATPAPTAAVPAVVTTTTTTSSAAAPTAATATAVAAGIAFLVELGCPRAEAVSLLQASNNNIDQAAALYFGNNME